MNPQKQNINHKQDDKSVGEITSKSDVSSALRKENEIEKERYERYIEETIDGIKDYVRETKGENINKYHHWKDMLEIVETFRVDMLSIIEEKGSLSQKKDVLKILGSFIKYSDAEQKDNYLWYKNQLLNLKKRLEQNDN